MVVAISANYEVWYYSDDGQSRICYVCILFILTLVMNILCLYHILFAQLLIETNVNSTYQGFSWVSVNYKDLFLSFK